MGTGVSPRQTWPRPLLIFSVCGFSKPVQLSGPQGCHLHNRTVTPPGRAVLGWDGLGVYNMGLWLPVLACSGKLLRELHSLCP